MFVQILLLDLLQMFSVLSINQPREDGVIGQDRDYLTYPEIDLTQYKKQTKVDSILRDYNQAQLSKLQVTKQADLLMLLFMLGELFSKEVRAACWKYYEPRTTHDSSLSYCTHCIMASDVDDTDLAYPMFQKSWSIDMGENMDSSDAGVHTASIGGIWQCVVMGFGGMRLTDHGLRIEPKLPDAWNGLSFSLNYQGEKLLVVEKRDADNIIVNITNVTGGKTVPVLVQGREIIV